MVVKKKSVVKKTVTKPVKKVPVKKAVKKLPVKKVVKKTPAKKIVKKPDPVIKKDIPVEAPKVSKRSVPVKMTPERILTSEGLKRKMMKDFNKPRPKKM